MWGYVHLAMGGERFGIFCFFKLLVGLMNAMLIS